LIYPIDGTHSSYNFYIFPVCAMDKITVILICFR